LFKINYLQFESSALKR